MRTFCRCTLLLILFALSISARADALVVAQSGQAVDQISAADAAGSDRFDFGILWRIDNGTSVPSFLFGTMHVEDPRVTELPQPVMDAFNRSRSLTTEALLELEQLLLVGPELLLVDGSNLIQLIGENLYSEVTSALSARGITPDIAAVLKPWAVALLLSQPRSQTGMFLDRQLYQLAQQNGKPVFGLETIAEQLAVFKTMSLQDQISLLEETLAQLELIPEAIERLTQAYLNRDLAMLAELADEQFTGSSVQQNLKQRLIVDRNINMAHRMQQRFAEGGAFVAIGALHLAGPDGVLNYLQQLGYNVTRVY